MNCVNLVKVILVTLFVIGAISCGQVQTAKNNAAVNDRTEIVEATDSNIATDSSGSGKSARISDTKLFTTYCASCHGEDGTAGIAGAANLKNSRMNPNEVITQITNGKGGMPAFDHILSSAQIGALATYVQKLQK